MAIPVGRLGAAVSLALLCLSSALAAGAVTAARSNDSAIGAGPLLLAGASVVALLCAAGLAVLLRQTHRTRGTDDLALREATRRNLALLEATRGFEAILAGSSDVMLLTDSTGTVSYASPASVRMLGLAGEDLRGRELTELVEPADAPALIEALQQLTRNADVELTLDLRVPHRDGSTRLLETRVRNQVIESATNDLVWNARDVTERRSMDQELAHRAFHDALTGVPNRALLLDRLNRALDRADRTGSVVAAMVVDFDDLKEVNDSLGRAAGDEIVLSASARLQKSVRPGDTVARLGGDEFVVLLEEVRDVDELTSLVENSLAGLSEPFDAARRSLLLTSTAGIATNRTAQLREGAEGLLRDAHMAMYAARHSQRRYLVFEQRMREQAQNLLDLTVDIRAATAEGQIQVLYQPLVHLETGELEGFEALARWHHPSRGQISPITFIPVAEDSGAIHDIGRHVLETACRQAASWDSKSPGQLRISVNVSPFQLAGDEIIDHVLEALETTGLPPHQLILEMTESALVHDIASVSRRLQRLRIAGVRIAMDDFGTGYSSLAYLRRLPLDIVKIDKSFVDDEHGAGPQLLSNVIALGTTLGLDTVAEGIEEPEQLNRARAAGCTYGQGYLIARPLDERDASQFLADHAVHEWMDLALMAPGTPSVG